MAEEEKRMTEKLLCGVDLGGTKLSVGLFTRSGESVAENKVTDHSELGNDGMVGRIADLVKELLEREGVGYSDIEGVGIGLAGHINAREGLIITTSNFPSPFRNYRFRDRLREHLETRIIVDNDANAQALGEYRFGAGQGRNDVVFMTVSTGVGAGVIVDGRLVRGHSGFAGEIGHTIVEPSSSIQCTCGNYGCLMALSGTISLTDRYRKYQDQGMKSILDEAEISAIDGMILEKGLHAGDEISRRLFTESAGYIGIGIYNMYQFINPQMVILGGGLMKLGEEFLGLIRDKFESMVQNMVHEELQIVTAGLGNRAGLIGAAALTLESP